MRIEAQSISWISQEATTVQLIQRGRMMIDANLDELHQHCTMSMKVLVSERNAKAEHIRWRRSAYNNKTRCRRDASATDELIYENEIGSQTKEKNLQVPRTSRHNELIDQLCCRCNQKCLMIQFFVGHET